ncbi:MAG: dTDP-4-dehydrorhamnose reductase [Chloroflexota bacterium]
MSARRRLLLVGKTGQLGWELQRALLPLGDLLALDYPELDLAQPEAVSSLLAGPPADLIINDAAYTAVDRAEQQPEPAMAINGRAPGQLAELARRWGAALVHFSTDFVFDGLKGAPYVESDLPRPVNQYGLSKLAGEQAVAAAGGAYLVLRTSWVYSTRRDSFVAKVLEWSRTQPELKVVNDQVGSPTWARALAEITAQLLAQALVSTDPYAWLAERRGVYHLAGDGAASRYEWAAEILALDPHPELRQAGRLLPALTADFPAPACRPPFSALDCGQFARVFGLQLPDWRVALQLALQT